MSSRLPVGENRSEPRARVLDTVEERPPSRRAIYPREIPIPLGLVWGYRWYAFGLAFLAVLWIAFGMVMVVGQHPWTWRATLGFLGLIVLTVAFVVLTVIQVREASRLSSRL